MKKTLALDTRHSVTSPRPRPQYAGEIRKRNFISARLDLPSTLIRHENGGFWKRSSNQTNLKSRLLLRLGLPFTLIRHKNALQTGGIWKRRFISTVRPAVHTNPSRKRSFLRTLFNPSKFENTGFPFRVDGKHFEKQAFQKRWRHDNHVISLTEFSLRWPNTVIKSLCLILHNF